MNVKLPLIPGVFKDETPLSAGRGGFYVDSQWCRAVRGKMETMGGFEKASTDEVSGICRGLHAWHDSSALSYEGIGTHSHLMVYHDGEIYDVTPLDSWGQLTNPFSTTDEDNTVTVAHTAHGRAVGDRVDYPGGPTVGGLDMGLAEWTVATLPNANSYTFEHTSAATSTVSSSGGTVDYEYILAIGLIDNLGGPGYGVGGYGSGTYGTAASDVTFYPRVWTMDNWGNNLIACPRGGKIYEFEPSFSNSETVTNGTFASDSDWTKGTGWTIGAGVATASAGTGSDLSQSLTLTPGAYFVLEFDLTRSAGTIQPKLGGTSIGSALSAAGHYKYQVFNYGASLAFTKDSSFAGTLDNVTVKQSLRAVQIPNAPEQNTLIWVTDQRILVAAGTVESSTSLFNAMHIRWSDQENNQDWTPGTADQSGFFTLAKGGRIVAGHSGNNENVVWTDVGIHVMRYVADPNVVYRFDFMGGGCGPMGTNATIMLGGAYYWMANTGQFFQFTGGAPEPLHSPVRRDIFDSMAQGQGEKVYAFATAAFNEAGWLVPDSRNTNPNECNSYVLLSVSDQAWATGDVDRTAWLDSGGLDFSSAVSSVGVQYFQEKGRSADGAALNWRLKTGSLEIVDGNELMRIQQLTPDFDDFVGGCSVTMEATIYPNSPSTSVSGDITSATEKLDLRVTGGQIQVEFEGTAAPAFMRTGNVSVDIIATGQHR
tara:strand:- start:4519 stop:6642 length:2124 start_codon:yes stop_codon:yes gene_type:complete